MAPQNDAPRSTPPPPRRTAPQTPRRSGHRHEHHPERRRFAAKIAFAGSRRGVDGAARKGAPCRAAPVLREQSASRSRRGAWGRRRRRAETRGQGAGATDARVPSLRLHGAGGHGNRGRASWSQADGACCTRVRRCPNRVAIGEGGVHRRAWIAYREIYGTYQNTNGRVVPVGERAARCLRVERAEGGEGGTTKLAGSVGRSSTNSCRAAGRAGADPAT